MNMNFRIGYGFDVHQLVEGRDFYLGGVKLDSTKGALGHSDADVLVHAICDALLGAANMRDIGHHFQNTDDRWKGISSLILLEETIKLIETKGYKVGNIDCMVCLEAPKVNPHITAMQEKIAKVMKVDVDAVSIKATTNEKLGYIGRGEGITASAVALIYKG
jgi:2-C-methyl-D-erythritol 2,4-cyclodiphosphate synthase